MSDTCFSSSPLNHPVSFYAQTHKPYLSTNELKSTSFLSNLIIKLFSIQISCACSISLYMNVLIAQLSLILVDHLVLIHVRSMFTFDLFQIVKLIS